jgi:hypothetical protein
MELKVWRDGGKNPRISGLKQLDGDLAGPGLDSGSELVTMDSGRRITIIHA